jgi:hypothetical protein
MFSLLGKSLGWLVRWLYYVSIICLIGASLGVVTHVGFGLLFFDDPDYGYLAAFGFQNGLRYASVWAGGISIVICIMRARKEYLAKHAEKGSPES